MLNWWALNSIVGFLWNLGSVSKESACNAGDWSLISGWGRSLGEGNGNPLQYSFLENPMDRGAWWATVHGIARVAHGLVTKPPPPNSVAHSRLNKVYWANTLSVGRITALRYWIAEGTICSLLGGDFKWWHHQHTQQKWDTKINRENDTCLQYEPNGEAEGGLVQLQLAKCLCFQQLVPEWLWKHLRIDLLNFSEQANLQIWALWMMKTAFQS